MADEPYIKLPRRLFRAPEAGGLRHWCRRRGKASEFDALLDLYQRAAYEDGARWELAGGGFIYLKRGETPPLSFGYLAHAWGWASSTVEAFMERESRDGGHVARSRLFGKDGGTWMFTQYEAWACTGDAEREPSREAAREGQPKGGQQLTGSAGEESEGDAGGGDGGGGAEQKDQGKQGEGSGKGRPNGSRGSVPDEHVQIVYRHWLAVSGRGHALSEVRKRKIVDRLRRGRWTVEQLCAVADSAHRNPWYLGRNERSTYYGSIETIYKSDETVERHLEWGAENPAARGGGDEHDEVRQFLDGEETV